MRHLGASGLTTLIGHLQSGPPGVTSRHVATVMAQENMQFHILAPAVLRFLARLDAPITWPNHILNLLTDISRHLNCILYEGLIFCPLLQWQRNNNHKARLSLMQVMTHPQSGRLDGCEQPQGLPGQPAESYAE